MRLQKARPAQAPYSEVKLSREGAKPRREQHVFCLLRVSAPSREAIFRNIVITKQQTEVSQVRLRFDLEYEKFSVVPDDDLVRPAYTSAF
ncbi:MAG: hypothetical protein DWI00_01470 [Planctomycetota bacterium]|nr:MAG: hypothetical protein DWI00_01470 [Planctomycetota bacterium]